jgi:ATP-dependent protease ClpP protease subunit
MDISHIKKNIYINGPLNKDSYQKFLLDVEKYIIQNTPDPLLVIFTSGGGSTYYGITLYEMLRILPFPVITLGIGFVDSASILPFMAGAQRFITPQTTFTFHLPSQNSSERSVLSEVLQTADDLKSYFEKYSQIISERAGKISHEEMKSIQINPRTFSSSELVEKGIAHEIVPYINH